MQVDPPVHATPHPPQLRSLVRVSTHAPAQAVVPVGQVTPQVPPLQTWLVMQRAPQAPQLAALVRMSTQTPLQSVWPIGHWHRLLKQNCPALQAIPQPPQLAASTWVKKHPPPHRVWPGRQSIRQRPKAHT